MKDVADTRKRRKTSPLVPVALRKPTANEKKWTFLSSHTHVLLCIVRNPNILMRDMAELVGITERAVQGIVADLQGAGYLLVERKGRQNLYRVKGELPMRHSMEKLRSVSCLIDLIQGFPAVEFPRKPVRKSAQKS
jgi:hypothetical protein